MMKPRRHAKGCSSPSDYHQDDMNSDVDGKKSLQSASLSMPSKGGGKERSLFSFKGHLSKRVEKSKPPPLQFSFEGDLYKKKSRPANDEESTSSGSDTDCTLCVRQSHQRRAFERFQRMKEQEKLALQQIIKPPLSRVPIVRDPLPIKAEEFNPLRPEQGKLIRRLWKHAHKTVEDPESTPPFQWERTVPSPPSCFEGTSPSRKQTAIRASSRGVRTPSSGCDGTGKRSSSSSVPRQLRRRSTAIRSVSRHEEYPQTEGTRSLYTTSRTPGASKRSSYESVGDARGWQQQQRGRERTRQYPTVVLGRSKSPHYLRDFKHYGIDAPGYETMHPGEVCDTGMTYTKQYELPTISRFLKAKHPVFLRARSQTPSRKVRSPEPSQSTESDEDETDEEEEEEETEEEEEEEEEECVTPPMLVVGGPASVCVPIGPPRVSVSTATPSPWPPTVAHPPGHHMIPMPAFLPQATPLASRGRKSQKSELKHRHREGESIAWPGGQPHDTRRKQQKGHEIIGSERFNECCNFCYGPELNWDSYGLAQHLHATTAQRSDLSDGGASSFSDVSEMRDGRTLGGLPQPQVICPHMSVIPPVLSSSPPPPLAPVVAQQPAYASVHQQPFQPVMTTTAPIASTATVPSQSHPVPAHIHVAQPGTALGIRVVGGKDFTQEQEGHSGHTVVPAPVSCPVHMHAPGTSSPGTASSQPHHHQHVIPVTRVVAPVDASGSVPQTAGVCRRDQGSSVHVQTTQESPVTGGLPGGTTTAAVPPSRIAGRGVPSRGVEQQRVDKIEMNAVTLQPTRVTTGTQPSVVIQQPQYSTQGDQGGGSCFECRLFPCGQQHVTKLERQPPLRKSVRFSTSMPSEGGPAAQPTQSYQTISRGNAPLAVNIPPSPGSSHTLSPPSSSSDVVGGRPAVYPATAQISCTRTSGVPPCQQGTRIVRITDQADHEGGGAGSAGAVAGIVGNSGGVGYRVQRVYPTRLSGGGSPQTVEGSVHGGTTHAWSSPSGQVLCGRPIPPARACHSSSVTQPQQRYHGQPHV